LKLEGDELADFEEDWSVLGGVLGGVLSLGGFGSRE